MDINTQILRADRYYSKLSKQDMVTILEKAPQMASILANEYPLDKMNKILEQNKFIVTETENAEQSLIKYRARILISKQNQIFIYTDSVSEMVAKFPQITREQAKMMFIAHEFIHYLEFKKTIDTSYIIESKKLGFKRRLEVHAYSEMVANEYARLVTGSRINPMEIDKENYEL